VEKFTSAKVLPWHSFQMALPFNQKTSGRATKNKYQGRALALGKILREALLKE